MLLIGLLVFAGLVFLALLAMLGKAAWIARQFTFSHRVPVYGHPSQFGLVLEDATFPSRHDKIPLSGWYLPASPDDRCIILIQGEEHHRNSPGIRALQLGRDLVQRGFSVLLFDFRGRGESGGARSSAGDREQWDVLGAIDYVTSRGIPVERIGLLGFSLGAAVAIMVAAREPRVPAIVSDSGFLDTLIGLRKVSFYRFRFPSWYAYAIAFAGGVFFNANLSKVRPIKVVGSITQPIFFIHGQEDPVIPFGETEALHRASGNDQDQVWIVPGSGHVNSYRLRPEEYSARVAGFFEQHIG